MAKELKLVFVKDLGTPRAKLYANGYLYFNKACVETHHLSNGLLIRVAYNEDKKDRNIYLVNDVKDDSLKFISDANGLKINLNKVLTQLNIKLGVRIAYNVNYSVYEGKEVLVLSSNNKSE